MTRPKACAREVERRKWKITDFTDHTDRTEVAAAIPLPAHESKKRAKPTHKALMGASEVRHDARHRRSPRSCRRCAAPAQLAAADTLDGGLLRLVADVNATLAALDAETADRAAALPR